MKSAISGMLLAGVCTFSGWASAEQNQGVDLGVRLGYAIPLGLAASQGGLEGTFSQTITGAVPIGLELNYRIEPMLSVGAYGQYAFGDLPRDVKAFCSATSSTCSVSNIRAGVQASYIAPLPQLEAWLGLTLGFERQTFTADGSADSNVRNILMTLPDFGAQGGVSFEVSPTFFFGPFVALSMGRISYGSSTIEGARQHLHIRNDDRRFHQWLQLGIRGNFTP